MRTLLSCALALCVASSAFGEEVKVYAAAVVKSPLLKMAAEYEAATGNKVVCVFDTAGATEQKFRADPAAALLITTETLINDRANSGDSRTERASAWAPWSPVSPYRRVPPNRTSRRLRS